MCIRDRNRLDDALNGDLLVIARHLAGEQVEGLQQMRGRGGRQCGRSGQAGEQFGGCGVTINDPFATGGVVDLDDPLASCLSYTSGVELAGIAGCVAHLAQH